MAIVSKTTVKQPDQLGMGGVPDNIVLWDDQGEQVPAVPWVETGDIVDNSVTSDKVNLSYATSTSSSINLSAGVWLVTHKVSVGQMNISNPIILEYTINGFPGKSTIAGKCDVQNLWQVSSESAIVVLNATTTISRSNSITTNAETRDEFWTAIRIK